MFLLKYINVLDEKGEVTFSDRIECQHPDKIFIKSTKFSTGKKIPEKITLSNADELRKSPNAVKLSFSKELKYAVSGYYEGFYIVHSDHVSIFIVIAKITRTSYGNRDDVNLDGIQFALITSTRFGVGFDKDNWLVSDIYEINHKLDKSESVVYQNIGFEIWTVGYNSMELKKYKIAGVVSFDQNSNVPILSNEFLNIDNK